MKIFCLMHQFLPSKKAYIHKCMVVSGLFILANSVATTESIADVSTNNNVNYNQQLEDALKNQQSSIDQAKAAIANGAVSDGAAKPPVVNEEIKSDKHTPFANVKTTDAANQAPIVENNKEVVPTPSPEAASVVEASKPIENASQPDQKVTEPVKNVAAQSPSSDASQPSAETVASPVAAEAPTIGKTVSPSDVEADSKAEDVLAVDPIPSDATTPTAAMIESKEISPGTDVVATSAPAETTTHIAADTSKATDAAKDVALSEPVASGAVIPAATVSDSKETKPLTEMANSSPVKSPVEAPLDSKAAGQSPSNAEANVDKSATNGLLAEPIAPPSAEKNSVEEKKELPKPPKAKKNKAAVTPKADLADVPETVDVFDDKLNKGEPFSLENAIEMGLSKDPDLQISLEREKQTRFFTREGQSGYYPRVELNAKGEQQYNDPAAGFTGRKGHSNLAGEKTLSMNQILFDGFSTIEEVHRRKQLEKSAQIRTRMQEEKTLLDIIKFYSQICQYQRTVVEAQNFIVEMKNITDKLQLMETAGGASKAQLDLAKSRLAFATTELNTAVSSLNSAKSNLENLTGPLPEILTHFPADLHLDKKDMDYYINTAKENNSNILLNRSEQQALRHRLSAEEGGDYPSLNFRMEGRETTDDGGLTKTTTQVKATVLLSYVLADGKERSSIKSRVKSQIEELNIQDRKNYIDMEKNVKLSYQQLLAKRQSLESIEDEIKSNESLRGLNRQNLKLGNINILEMIDVEERLYAAKARKQQSMADVTTNSYELLEQAGILQKAQPESETADETPVAVPAPAPVAPPEELPPTAQAPVAVIQ